MGSSTQGRETVAASPRTDIRILLADDQRLLRETLATLLAAEPDFSVVGQAADGADAVALASELAPDVILMDIRMPKLDGIAATRTICAKPDLAACRVVMLTMFGLDEYVLAAVRAGAAGFLLKDTPPQALVDAVRTVHSGQALLSASAWGSLAQHLPASATTAPGTLDLTERQRDVLALVGQGLSNTEIEQALFISKGTVKSHIAALLSRLNARDRAQLVIAAYEHGLVTPRSTRRGS